MRSVGNSQTLKETALVEAFNLKAAIEYQLKNFEACKEALTDMPPRDEEELDPVTLHNQGLMNMDTDPTSGFKKLNFLLSQQPFPPETFGNLLILFAKYQVNVSFFSSKLAVLILWLTVLRSGGRHFGRERGFACKLFESGVVWVPWSDNYDAKQPGRSVPKVWHSCQQAHWGPQEVDKEDPRFWHRSHFECSHLAIFFLLF